ncbi:MAG: hypothetical protein JSR77_17290 [Planctomycetes bacterium]|nr:hypothetical protein [Planctomycetota bacterium]
MMHLSNTPTPPPQTVPPPPADSLPIPATPPTIPGRLAVVAKPPTWHTPLGIAFLVMGILGALMAGSQMVAGITVPAFIPVNVPGAQASIATIKQHAGESAAVWGFTLLCAVMLAISGGMLIGKRRAAVTLLLVWACLRIVSGIVQATHTYFMQKAQFAAMMEEMSKQQGARPVPPGVFAAIGGVSSVMAFLWAAALPVFVFIWFSRPSVRAFVHSWKR